MPRPLGQRGSLDLHIEELLDNLHIGRRMLRERQGGERSPACQRQGYQQLVSQMLPHGNVCREVVLCRLHGLRCHSLGAHTTLAEASENFGEMLAGHYKRHHIAWTACIRYRLNV